MVNITVNIDCLTDSDNTALDFTVDRNGAAKSPEVTINGAIDNNSVAGHIKVIVDHFAAGNGDGIATTKVSRQNRCRSAESQQHSHQSHNQSSKNLLCHNSPPKNIQIFY